MPPIRTPSSRGPEPARYSIGSVNLPVNPPVLPMLAKRVDELPAGGHLDLRTEVGWVSRAGLPRRGRDPDPEPRRKIAEPLLSRVARAAAGAVARSLRARWRNRHRKEWRARLRSAAAPHSSGRVAGEASVAGNPGIDRVLRPALRGRSGSAGRTVPKPAPGAGIAALIRGAADPSDAGDLRIERRGGLVSAASKARVSTGSWPSRFQAPTSRTSA